MSSDKSDLKRGLKKPDFYTKNKSIPKNNRTVQYLSQVREENTAQVNIESMMSNSDEAGAQANENLSVCLSYHDNAGPDTTRDLLPKLKKFKTRRVMFEQNSEEGHHSNCSNHDCDIWKKADTKVNYGSRRKKNFDVGEQDDDDEKEEHKYIQTAALTYRDTQGNTRTI